MKVFSLAIAIFLCFSFIGCTESNDINDKGWIGNKLENVLDMPDKIIIYSEGNTKEIDKSNSKYKKIFQLTNDRFHDKISTVKDVINDEHMEDIRKDGLGIEFIYDKEQSMSIKGDGFTPFKYYKLYFQLTSKKYGNSQGSIVHTLQYGDKDHYKDCSRGFLKYLEELVKTVESLK